MAQPGLDERLGAIQPLEPRLPPRRAYHQRVRRLVEVGQHRRRPLAHVHRRYAPADVVDVIGVPVIAAMDSDHASQLGGRAGRQLERRECTPRDAHHANRTGAPRPFSEPGDDLFGVALLLLCVLVLEDPG